MSERIRRYRLADCLQDIIDNTSSIELYVAELDEEGLAHDRLRYDAVERCLERVSEAAAKLGTQADELAPGPPWHAVRVFGSVLRHAYDQVDPARIWEIATRDLPQVAAAAEAALQRLDAKPE